jgi:hypothetical protein
VHPGAGSPPAVGTVDVLPLVNQLDGNGNPVPHGKVFRLPYMRMQSGAWAVICDPSVGDIGIVVCSDRDISTVKSNSDGQQANPGSYRQFDLADGVYLGGILNALPSATMWLRSDGGLKIVDGFGNVLETSASGFALTPAGGIMTVNGAIRATGSMIAGFGGVDAVGVQTHLHTSGDSGSPTSTPTPGS